MIKWSCGFLGVIACPLWLGWLYIYLLLCVYCLYICVCMYYRSERIFDCHIWMTYYWVRETSGRKRLLFTVHIDVPSVFAAYCWWCFRLRLRALSLRFPRVKSQFCGILPFGPSRKALENFSAPCTGPEYYPSPTWLRRSPTFRSSTM